MRHRYHRWWRNIFLSIQVWRSVWQISTGSDVEWEERIWRPLKLQPGESLTRARLWDRRMTRVLWFKKHRRGAAIPVTTRWWKNLFMRYFKQLDRSNKTSSKIRCQDGHQNKKAGTYQPTLLTCTALARIDFKVLLLLYKACDRIKWHTLCLFTVLRGLSDPLRNTNNTNKKTGSTITLTTQRYRRCKLREHLINNNW